MPTGVLNTFAYNGDGQRVELQDSSGTSKQIWDGQKILEETYQDDVVQVIYTLSPGIYGDLVSQRRSGSSSFSLWWLLPWLNPRIGVYLINATHSLCGGYDARFAFTVAPHWNPTIVIQELAFSGSIIDCEEKMECCKVKGRRKTKPDDILYEVLDIVPAAPWTRLPVPGDINTKNATSAPCCSTKGYCQTHRVVKQFDITQLNMNEKKAATAWLSKTNRINYNKCGALGSSTLKASLQPPPFWNNEKVIIAAAHTFLRVIWNCCENPSSQTFYVSADIYGVNPITNNPPIPNVGPEDTIVKRCE